MNDISRFRKMAEIKLTKMNRAEFLLETVQARFSALIEVIGPAGEIPMLLADTQHHDQATNIAILVDEVSTEINEITLELKKENNRD